MIGLFRKPKPVPPPVDWGQFTKPDAMRFLALTPDGRKFLRDRRALLRDQVSGMETQLAGAREVLAAMDTVMAEQEIEA